MKYTYKKMASGGSVKKEKGYTAKERKGLQSLIEELADPYAGDVTGGSSVTSVKKPKKRMAAGGPVGGGGRDSGRASAGASRSASPSRSSKGGGKYGADLSKSFGRNWADNTYTGRAFSAGARAIGAKGFAAGGIVGRPARSYRDMKAGAGSGVGRLQKTKIARGR